MGMIDFPIKGDLWADHAEAITETLALTDGLHGKVLVVGAVLQVIDAWTTFNLQELPLLNRSVEC